MNFAATIAQGTDPRRTALIAVDRKGDRVDVTFGAVEDASARMATRLTTLGVTRGDVVMTVMGNRPEWIATLMACYRIGAVALPCVTQSKAHDLALRARLVEPAAVVTTEEHAAEVTGAGMGCPVQLVPDETLALEEPAPFAELGLNDPALIIFTSGTSGEPKAVVHGVRYLYGQALQAEHWLDARPGDVVWCTAAAGWSKSVRNSFVAPWLRGAAAVVHDARFDPQQRIDLVRELGVNVLCMAPTEYRMMLRRARVEPPSALRSAVAAGEALDAATVEQWHAATATVLRDGFGQTETGAITTHPVGRPPRAGSMGVPLPGIELHLEKGELLLDPATTPTFFLRYLGRPAPDGLWATGDLVERDEDGYLWFKGRADDVIVSAGYRIGPTEVEASLTSHPAVLDAAVVGAPDPERGQIVRAVVVLTECAQPSDALARELQDHVKAHTAPYKYPRVVDFATKLPRTASGKLQRALVR